MNYSKQGYKLYSREEMIDLITKYYNKNNKIVLRDLRHKNNLPSQTQVINEFGSFQNCLKVCNIPLYNDKIFNRKQYTKEELLLLYKNFVDKHLKNNIFLPTYDEIDQSYDLPSSSVYLKEFGTLSKLNKLIGYNHKDFNNKALEKDMLDKYINACNDYGHVLNSREITKLSKENKQYIYCTETYNNHFGSIHNLQKICGFNVTIPGKNISKEEMINCLKKLGKELGRRPIQSDLKLYDFVPSANTYINEFGSFKIALKEAGFKYGKIFKNKNGKLFRSSYELKLANVLDFYNIKYETEIMYKDVIQNFKKLYRFDFEIIINNNKYYIELFGINGNELYEQRKNEKIKICNDNNISLIQLYQNDIYEKTNLEIYNNIINQINNM